MQPPDPTNFYVHSQVLHPKMGLVLFFQRSRLQLGFSKYRDIFPLGCQSQCVSFYKIIAQRTCLRRQCIHLNNIASDFISISSRIYSVKDVTKHPIQENVINLSPISESTIWCPNRPLSLNKFKKIYFHSEKTITINSNKRKNIRSIVREKILH